MRVGRANDPDQPPVVLAELGPGEIVGELEVLDQTPRSASVVVLERVSALEIGAPALSAAAAEFPEIAGALRRTVSGRLRNTNVLAAELFADLLRKVSLFSAVSAESLSKLAERGRRRTFAPETALMHQGEPGATMYVLAAGRVRVERAHPAILSPIPLAELGPGEVVGEIEVLDGAPRTATVVALDREEAMEIDAAALAETRAQCPDVAAALLQVVAQRLRSMNALLDRFGRPSPRRPHRP